MALRSRPVPRCDVSFGLMGAPHISDMTLTMLRTAHAVLDLGGSVGVWTCGYATMLTHEGLGESKPRKAAEWSREHATALQLARELIARDPGRVHWYVCRFCAEERGAGRQIPEVTVRPPGRFGDHMFAGEKSVLLGLV
jgi:hypothetical protein